MTDQRGVDRPLQADEADASPGQSATRAATDPRQVGIGFAWRQITIVAVVLLMMAVVVERLRPDELTDRGLATRPFVWSIVVWSGVILLNEFGFERSHMHHLQRFPLYVGAGAGAVVLIVGMVGLDTATATSKFPYVLVNALGAAIFWWGLAGLGLLVARWIAAEPDSNDPGQAGATDR